MGFNISFFTHWRAKDNWGDELCRLVCMSVVCIWHKEVVFFHDAVQMFRAETVSCNVIYIGQNQLYMYYWTEFNGSYMYIGIFRDMGDVWDKWAASWQNQQSESPPSLIWAFECAQWVAEGPRFLHVDSEDSDQTGRMPRLICLRWAHTHFVGFVMS